MAVQHFPDGIKIGPDLETSEEDNRLPIYDLDEWAVDVDSFSLNAGEVATKVFDGIMTVRAGATILARVGNPNANNNDKLLIKHAWWSGANQISVMVKNDSDSQVTYGQDQWVLSYWNTSAP